MWHGNHFPTFPDRQRGAALLVFMLIFFLASMSWILSQVNAIRSHGEPEQATSAALAQSKEILLARAASALNRPGSLPCPDFNDDGIDPNGACSETNTIGRLPWKTLGLADLRDGDGNRLWYVLTTELRNNSTSKINPAEPLGLSMDGVANIAAIVFSPGPPLVGQDGRLSNNIKDYLDDTNREGGPYVSGPASPTFNDRTIAISRSELFSVVNRRILGLLGADLDAYYVSKGNLYPDSDTDLKTALDSLVADFELALKIVEKEALEKRIAMLDENGWFAITSYSPAPDRKSAVLKITEPPAITCTIAYEKKRVCTQP
jgi:hypothetical protein